MSLVRILVDFAVSEYVLVLIVLAASGERSQPVSRATSTKGRARPFVAFKINKEYNQGYLVQSKSRHWAHDNNILGDMAHKNHIIRRQYHHNHLDLLPQPRVQFRKVPCIPNTYKDYCSVYIFH